jgi:hypothetical protein
LALAQDLLPHVTGWLGLGCLALYFFCLSFSRVSSGALLKIKGAPISICSVNLAFSRQEEFVIFSKGSLLQIKRAYFTLWDRIAKDNNKIKYTIHKSHPQSLLLSSFAKNTTALTYL